MSTIPQDRPRHARVWSVHASDMSACTPSAEAGFRRSPTTLTIPDVLHHTDSERSSPSGGKIESGSTDIWDRDLENPRNWSRFKKWINVLVVSLYTVIPPLASSMMAPGLPEVTHKYSIANSTITALTLSIFLLSFAIGPLILAPLSEMYGRKWVLHVGNTFSTGFNLGCAFAPNTRTLIAMRFLAGLSGSAPLACGGGVIADLFSEEDRASAMAIYSLGPLLGSALGPIAGGYIVQAVGVRYVFIVITGASAFAGIFGIIFLKETYAPVLLLRHPSRDVSVSVSHQEEDQQQEKVDPSNKWVYLWTNLTRPAMLLTRSFVCFILALYMAFMNGIYYLMFTTFTEFFHETYGFDARSGGLVYLGLGTGLVAATLFGVRFADQIYHHLARKNNGQAKPEMRIPASFIGTFFVPTGLLWYGWSAAAKLHWIMPIIGSGLFGFGMMTTVLPISLYLIDAFTYGASALAAAYVLRSLLGFIFPLFASQMFHALGIGPGNTLLAGLSMLLGIPFPFWIYFCGESLRKRNPLNS